MKNINVVALIMHSNKEIIEHTNVQGYYDEEDYVPLITETEYHRRLKILDKVVSNDNTTYIAMSSNGDIYTVTTSQILSIDNRANGLDSLLKEKS